MENNRPKGKYWVLCIIWLVIMIVMLADVGETRKYFWLALPGVVTYFVMAMDLLDTSEKRDF
jgi:hypothetical protein